MEKKNKCCFCQKNIVGGFKDIDLKYAGYLFSVFKSGLECSECVKKKFIKLFKEFGEDLIIKNDSGININWHLFTEIEKQARQGTYRGDQFIAMKRILISLGILSVRSEGNYEIVESVGIRLNPSTLAVSLYFTQEKDAILYMQYKYRNSQFSFEIRKIGKVIPSHKIF